MRTTALVMAAMLTQAAAGSSQSPAPHPAQVFLGTWTLNLEKSSYRPGPAPQQQTRRYALRPDGLIVITTSAIDAAGNPTFNQVAMRADGKPYPYYTQATLPDLLASGSATTTFQTFRLIDAHTMAEERVQGGKVTATQQQVVSADGRTLTISAEGANQGQPFKNVAVFDRQGGS